MTNTCEAISPRSNARCSREWSGVRTRGGGGHAHLCEQHVAGQKSVPLVTPEVREDCRYCGDQAHAEELP